MLYPLSYEGEWRVYLPSAHTQRKAVAIVARSQAAGEAGISAASASVSFRCAARPACACA